jgi:tape measure domain-containing protein
VAVIDELKILVTAEVASAVANLNKVEGASTKAGGGFKDFAKQVAGYTTAAGLAVSATKAVISGIVNLTKESISLAMGFETAKISWGVLLGDMGEGEKMFSKIQALAAKTPLSFESVEQGARTLKQFGLATADILPTIKMLGDVSAGNADKLRGLSVVYGQIMSTGRLMGQDLLQLINQGFNPLTIISKKTGESMAELKKRMEQGGISAQEVADAFKSATSEGGLFYGMMDKTALTASGQLSTAMDNIKMQMAAFGDSLLTVINPALKSFNEHMDEIAKRKTLGDAFEKGSALGVEGLRDAIKTLEAEMKRLGYTGEASLSGIGEAYQEQLNNLKQSLAYAVAMDSKTKAIADAAQKAADAAARKAKADKDAAEADIDNSRARLATWAAMNERGAGYFKMLADAEEAAQKEQSDNDKARLATWDMANKRGQGYLDMLNAVPEAWAKAKAATDAYWNSVWDANEADAQSSIRLNFGKEGKADLSAWDEYIKKIQESRDETQILVDMAETWRDAWGNAWESVGQALVSGEEGWKSLGKVAVNTISGILEALGKELTIRAIKALFEGNIAGAALAGGGAAAAYIAAGAVKAIPMAEGGSGVVTKPTLFLAGESGPEPYAFGGAHNKRGMSLGNNVTVHVHGSLIRERELWQQIQAVSG